MHLGENIQISDDFPVSPQLRKNIQVIQKTYALWNEYYRANFGMVFNQVSVLGGFDVPPVANSDTVSFFSGGIDGLDTLLRRIEDVDYFLFVQGIDMQLENELYFDVFEELEKFIGSLGKRLLPIKTNIRFLGHYYGVRWQSCCAGSGLASIALAGGFRTCFVASTNSHNIFYPDGSNVITDPLWGNGETEIIYDGGEFRRIEKTQHIVNEAPAALDILRVCWQDKGYNCGACDKCLRTMLTLRLLGASARTLPKITRKDLDKIRSLRFYREDDLEFHKEIMELAIQVGDKEAIKALLPPIRRFRVRKLAKEFAALVRGDVA